MGIHRISRQSTSALANLASSSSTSASTLLLRFPSASSPKRHTSTAISRSAVHVDDPYDRILPPRFPSEDAREAARAALSSQVGSDLEIKLALFPFWSLAFTFYGDVSYYLPSGASDNHLIRHAVPRHPFLVTSEVCGLRDPAFTTLQFPVSPEFYLTGNPPPSPHNPPCPILPELDLELLYEQPPSLSDPFGPPVRFSLGPPRPVLQALHIPSPTADVERGLDIYTLPIKTGSTVTFKGEKKPADVRGLFPKGGTMARIMDSPVGFDRVASPIRKPLLIAYEAGRPVAAIDPLTMIIQTSTLEHSKNNWKDMTSNLHTFSKVTGGRVSGLKTAQFTGAHLAVAAANREKLDWTGDYIHSLRLDRYRTGELVPGSSLPRTQLSHVRHKLTERLATVQSSTSGSPIKSAGQDQNAATERQKMLEQEGIAERLALAALRQKRLKAEADRHAKVVNQTDAKRREKLAEMKKREARQAKYQANKTAKGRRTEERQREDDKRRRLEEAMAAAAAELYGSRKAKVVIRGKINDPNGWYKVLGFSSLNTAPTDAEMKDAYRAKMQEHHPDRPGGSTEMASKVNTAFDSLDSDDKRLMYQRDTFWNQGGSAGRR